jgi:protein-disulfide isomerase
MKVHNVLACAVAVLALAGCNKNKHENAPTANEKVTITQATPPPGGDWTDVVNATSAGFMMGNPNAKVKLIEIGALTCPHCREFEEKGVPILMDKYVKSGQVSWEFRNYLLHGPDISAALIARCNGVKSFFPLVKAFYADQESWMGKIMATPEAQLDKIQNLPENQQFVELAKVAGLQDWAAARGIPQAKSNQCLSDPRKIDQLVQLSSDVQTQYPDFEGTPSFVLNGKLLPDTFSWEKLQPQLDAAVK